MLPLIGVSTYVADVAWSNWERRAAVLPASYFELVAAAGGRPLLVPPTSTAPDGPEAGADQVVDVLDGLVLTGGGAMLHGLEARLQNETGMPIVVARAPLHCVAIGAGQCLEEFEALKQVLITSSAR